MNTPNGNFIEKSIPNIKNATLALNIGGVDATMPVEKFAAAITTPTPAPVPAYKSYSVLVTDGGAAFPPTPIVLVNDFTGITFTWSRIAPGNYTITSSQFGVFTDNKTVVIFTNANTYSSYPLISWTWEEDYNNVIRLRNAAYINSTTLPEGVDNAMSSAYFEIRVYN